MQKRDSDYCKETNTIKSDANNKTFIKKYNSMFAAKIIFLKISLPFPFEDKSFASKITAKMRPSDPRLSCWFAIIQYIYRIVFVTHYQVKLRKNTYALYIFYFSGKFFFTSRLLYPQNNSRLT